MTIELLFIVFLILVLAALVSNSIVAKKNWHSLMYENTGVLLVSGLYWGACILLIAVAGFREIGVDPDSLAYAGYYNSPYIALITEPTFVFISALVKVTVNDFKYVLLVYAIISVPLKFRIIERLTEFKFLAILVFFSNYYLLHDFTQMRAAIATAIVLFMIEPLAERKLYKFLLLVLVAILFHYSAIVLLLLIVFSNKPLNDIQKVVIGLSIPLGIALHYQGFDLFLTIPIETVKLKIETYKAMQETAETALNVFNLVYLVKYIMLYVLLFTYEKLKDKSKYTSLLLKIYALSLFAYLALSQNTIVAMRVSELLGVVEIILVTSLCYLIKPRFLANLIVFIYALVYMYINIFYVIGIGVKDVNRL